MQAGLDALKTALRVLTAVTEHRDPEPADVQALLFICPTPHADPARRIGLRGDADGAQGAGQSSGLHGGRQLKKLPGHRNRPGKTER